MSTEENVLLARRWFTEGWAGNLDLADDLFAADFRNNEKIVGPGGPKRNVSNRLTGFPDMQSRIEEQISLDDTVVMHIAWHGTHLGLCSIAEFRPRESQWKS
jgi:hypothetical protein